MKSLIGSGRSPIKGRGRFPRYKNPKKYPGSRKSDSPVNLRLTGDFLDDLTYDTNPSGDGYTTDIGYFTEESRKKEEGHRAGANGQPKRPTIPARNETFVNQIREEILKIYEKRIRRLIR